MAQFRIVSFGLVSFGEVALVAQIAGLYEIDNAPEIEQAVFERSAGESQTLACLQLFHRLSDLGGRIFNELRFVQDDRLEIEFLQSSEIAPQQ